MNIMPGCFTVSITTFDMNKWLASANVYNNSYVFDTVISLRTFFQFNMQPGLAALKKSSVPAKKSNKRKLSKSRRQVTL